MRAEIKSDSFRASSPSLSRENALVQICVIDASGLSINYSMKPVVVS